MSFFISDAFADTVATTTPAATPGGSMGSLLLLIGFVVIFYLLIWMPQRKRAKEQRDLLSNLAKGDEVVTAGGILGRITKLDDNYVTLAVSETVELKVQKNSISGVLPKGTLKADVEK